MNTETKSKGMCIATRCTSVEHFIQMFHRYVDEESFFVSTLNTRPPGLETSFSVQLADGTPVLRGLCVVMQSWTNASNPFKTPGVRLGIKRLTANSMTVFEQLLVTRSATAVPKPKMLPAATPPPIAPNAPAQVPRVATQPLRGAIKAPPPIPKITPLRPIPEPVPTPIEPVFESAPTRVAAELERDVKTEVRTEKSGGAKVEAEPATKTERDSKPDVEARAATVQTPAPEETRTPGSDFVLPANPLMNLTDESLEGYVDCTLYEETGNFFPADDPMNFIDDVVPPPVLAPRPAVSRPIEVALSRLSGPLDVTPMPTGTTIPPPYAPTTIPPNANGTTVPPPYANGTTIPPYAAIEAVPLQNALDPSPTIPPPFAAAAEQRVDRVDLEPRARKRGLRLIEALPRVWLFAGGGVLLALVLTIAIVSKGGKTSTAAPASDKPDVHSMVAKVEPTPKPAIADPVPAASPTPADEEPPPGEGPPVVGAGPCRVAVTSTPAGSMISIDGASMGPSPITIATECGKRKVEIEHARYQTATKFASLDESKPGTLDVTLMRPTHAVSITSQPSGATVLIDGRRAGTTPTVINVMGFVNLNLEVKKAGFQTTVTKLYSKKPQDKVTIKLARW